MLSVSRAEMQFTTERAHMCWSLGERHNLLRRQLIYERSHFVVATVESGIKEARLTIYVTMAQSTRHYEGKERFALILPSWSFAATSPF